MVLSCVPWKNKTAVHSLVVAPHPALKTWFRLGGWWLLFAAAALWSGPPALADAFFPDPVTWPQAGDSDLRPLTDQWLELRLVQRQQSWKQGARPPLPEDWKAEKWRARVDGNPQVLEAVGWRRWPLRADYATFDLLLLTQVFFQLEAQLPSGAVIELTTSEKKLKDWGSGWRTSWSEEAIAPAIRFPRLGVHPQAPKFAYWAYDLGMLGELPLPSGAPAILLDASGREVFRGVWELRVEKDWAWHQKVWRFDFSAWEGEGEFWIHVPGAGRGGPVRICPEASAVVPRLLASAFYHQRSGAEKSVPWTRYGHAPSHTDPAWIPAPDSDPSFAPTRRHLANMVQKNTPPEQTAPPLLTPEASLFPFQRQGRVDVSGGHYDAGDYSKYTINSAHLIHHLTLAVDWFPGAAAQDELGLPESGDGLPDALQIALHEARFLMKMQDEDGGFYFLVYPRDRPYELDVLPQDGDPQVVFPKNTSATAAATGALAQLAASPHVQKYYPDLAEKFLASARQGFAFLQKAREQWGDEGSYQAISHYGQFAGPQDEWAYAAAALWLATGEEEFASEVMRVWPDPQGGADARWGWWPLFESFGNTARLLALDPGVTEAKTPPEWETYVGAMRDRLRHAAGVWMELSRQNAFGLPLSLASKRNARAGWFWAMDPAVDLMAASLLEGSDPAWLKEMEQTVAAWAGYETGANPQDGVFYSGAGPVWRREIVNRISLNDDRQLPVPGIPRGNVVSTPHHLRPYTRDGRAGLRSVFHPPLDQFAFYDRSATDAYNVREEWTVATGARLLAAHLFLLGRAFPEGLPAAPHPNSIHIQMEPAEPKVGEEISFHLTDGDGSPVGGLEDAVVVWEWAGREPVVGERWKGKAKTAGTHRVEVEILWPDGFRRADRREFTVSEPNP
jgi:hypothetical protein